jgi:DNA processing protein
MIELATTPDRDAVLSVPVNEHARWIALSRVKGLGCVSFRNLAAHFADPTRALSAPASELARVPDLDSDVIHSLRNFAEWKDVDEELRRIERSGAKLITFGDFDYPARLRNIADPPPVLYVKGEIQSIDDKAVAIVGSRSASDYGRRVARDLCRGLVSLGFTVVSGMALGIDGVAHETALNSGGRTIAVLGCGVDRVYPPNHAALYRRISEGGAVISELPIGTKPMAFNFPARNRLISGLSLGVVVVEATEKSGSLITARLALEQGREVFAVPGEVGSSRSRGSHRLLRQGAKLVENVNDIIEELAPQLLSAANSLAQEEPKLPKNVSDEVRKVFALLQEKSLQIDEVIESSGFPSAKVSQILLELELSGFLRQLPGKRYIAER